MYLYRVYQIILSNVQYVIYASWTKYIFKHTFRMCWNVNIVCAKNKSWFSFTPEKHWNNRIFLLLNKSFLKYIFFLHRFLSTFNCINQEHLLQTQEQTCNSFKNVIWMNAKNSLASLTFYGNTDICHHVF